MLAKVQLPEDVVNPAPPSFKAQLNSDPTSFTNSFSLTDTDNHSVANLILIEESSQEITIMLEGSATFADTPIEWAVPPAEGAPTVQTVSENVRSFTVLQPAHSLTPWAFRIVVDTTDVKGIKSQAIFLTKPVDLESGSTQLQYDPDQGTFILPGQTNDSKQVFLINANPASEQPSFPVQLSVPAGSSIVFADPPVVWSSASHDWITATRSTSDAKEMTLHVLSSGAGQSIGFQFAIEVTVGDTTTKVLSPDPILINATIGDG